MGANFEFDLQQYLTDMESRLTSEMRAGFLNQESRSTEMDARVRKLEGSRSYILGIWSVVSFAGAGVWELVAHLWKTKP